MRRGGRGQISKRTSLLGGGARALDARGEAGEEGGRGAAAGDVCEGAAGTCYGGDGAGLLQKDLVRGGAREGERERDMAGENGERLGCVELVLTAQTGRAPRSWARAGRATAARNRIEEVFILAKERDV